MSSFTGVAVGRARIRTTRIDRLDADVAPTPGQRAAAAGVLFAAGILFLTPPAVGLLVILGLVR